MDKALKKYRKFFKIVSIFFVLALLMQLVHAEEVSSSDLSDLEKSLSDLKVENEKIFDENEFQKMLDDPIFQEFMHYQAENKEIRFKEEQELSPDELERLKVLDEKRIFYDQYITKYYPKAFVIREKFFLNMTPDQIADALEDLVEVFSDKPWFYFSNFEGGIKIAHYWEYIVDQCSLISEFLKKARVYVPTRNAGETVQTPIVFLSEDNLNYSLYGVNFNRLFPSIDQKKLRESKSLFLYLKDMGRTVVYDFYALCFDYLIKLFNEGILLKNMNLVNKYYYELEFIMEKLRMSVYESDYQESVKTAKELITLLKQGLGIDDLDMLEDLFGDDEEAKKMARESYELGYF